MKTKATKLLTVILAVITALSFTACENVNQEPKGYAYVTFDVNPSIEIVVNNGKVTGVKAGNDDACVMLYGENFEGKDVQTVSKQLIELAQKMGYLSSTNTGVNLNVTADSEQVLARVTAQAKDGIMQGSSFAVVATYDRASDERKLKELKELNPQLFADLSANKLRLIEAVKAYDPFLTYEQACKMDLQQLTKALESNKDMFDDVAGDELTNKFEELFIKARDEVEASVASLYGTAYKTAFNKVDQLKKFANEIKAKANQQVLSQTDLDTILELLQIQATDVAEGEITAEMIKAYIDKMIDSDNFRQGAESALSSVISQVEQVLVRYGSAYTLSQQEKQALATIDETLSAITLDDVDRIVKEYGDDVERLFNSIIDGLDATAKALINAQVEIIERALVEIKQNVLNQMQLLIQTAKNKYSQLKAELLAHNANL